MLLNRRFRALSAGFVLVALILGGCGEVNTPTDPQAQEGNSREMVKLERINQWANEMYQQTASGNVVGGKEKLDDISEQLTKIQFSGITSLEGMNALFDTIEQAKRKFNSVQTSPEEALQEAVKIRLIADAMTHQYSPMWLEFDKAIRSELRRMELAASRQQDQELSGTFQRLEDRYETIRASIMVSRNPEIVEKLDSLFVFIKHQMQSTPIPYTEIRSAAKELDNALREVFYSADERTAYLPIVEGKDPIIWSAAMGAIILTVLGFVAWKMFHSDKRFARVPRDR
ncbi:sporulation protein YpjB [Chlamydia abortus]|uniref:Sporulation protein YpjB n=1 Tax=Paenibacillus residui TaxID=629724 RepID=A0ABW3D3B9_9BACL|nr:sporulation protein YpjB [Chlamydia abortus]